MGLHVQIKDIATAYPAYTYDAKAASKASNPDRRRKWLIPLVLLAQAGIKLLLDRCGRAALSHLLRNWPTEMQKSVWWLEWQVGHAGLAAGEGR